MSSLTPAKLGRRAGTALLSVTLLGSLMLTACAPATTTSDSKSQPSSSASASASASDLPAGIRNFETEAFDLTKQVSIPAPHAAPGAESSYIPQLYLGNGVVVKTKGEGDKYTVTFTPYEGKDGAWEYTSEDSLGKMNLMRWKGKSYIVLDGFNRKTEKASGLTAEKNTQAQIVVVLDAVTGKVINTFKGTEQEVATTSGGWSFTPRINNDENTGSETETSIPFLTGLTYSETQGQQVRLVDPVTGETIVTQAHDHGPVPLNNETGFLTEKSNSLGRSTTKGVFGNFAFIANENPDYISKTGSPMQNSTFTLVNTVTNESVSEMKCLGTGNDEKQPVYSANFRYVVFAGQFVFDTQTGKSFCTSPTGKEDVRKFNVSAIDNEGNMYGNADREYLRINLADNTKIETLIPDVMQKSVLLPTLITDKGSALFLTDAVIVAVPAKAGAED